MSREHVFALRFIVPGALLTVIGLGMLADAEWRSIGWRFAVGGPLAFFLGIYLWPRERQR